MRIGIIGCAHMHIWSYTDGLKQLGVEIVGAYDRNKEGLAHFCQEKSIQAFEELEVLLNTDIDTVLICSENAFHCQYTLAAAARHKHVIVEKPMAVTVEEADQMISACASASVKLMVTHPVRFSKPMQDLKRHMDNGQGGQLIAINATNHGKVPGGWFMEKALSGGGAIMDHTIHIADLVYWLYAPQIESVFARDGKWNSEGDVEDSGLLHVTFTDGTFMSLDTSWNRPKNYPVWGDASLTLVTDNGWIHADGFGRKAYHYSDGAQPSYIFYEEDMDLSMIKAFKQAIDEDLPSPVTGEDGRFTVLMAEMAYRSIEKGSKEINK